MKIKYQFFYLFLLTTTLSITIASFIVYLYGKQMLLHSVYAHLESISEAKKRRLEDILQKKEDMVYLLTLDLLKDYSEIDGKIQVDSLIKEVLAVKKAIPGVKDFHLANGGGEIYYSLHNRPSGKDAWLESAVMAGMKTYTKPYIYNAQASKDKLLLKFCAPVLKNDSITNIIIFDLDGEDIQSLSKDYTGLGKTGETIIAKKDSVIKFISSIRFHHNSDQYNLDPKEFSEVMAKAFTIKQGLLTDHKDYKGDEVFASIRYIPQTGWSLVTKIDKKEALKPVRKLMNILIIFNIIALGVVTAVAFIAGKHFSKSLTALKNSVIRIRNGDLSEPIHIYSQNELGELADAFNDMAFQLETKIKELKQSNDSLNKFAYVISHDLKSPLQSIRGLSSILKEEYSEKPLDKEGFQILDMLIHKSLKMEEMVHGVLDSAKRGSHVKEKENIDSYKLLKEVIDNLAPPPHITINLDKNLPVVKYNKVSLIQIFQNLLGNAIKYMDKPAGYIEAGAVKMENKHKFFIRDNGPGIKESDYNKIFLMFEGVNEEKKADSHGIGLSIVKKIITENNGEIWLESEPGQGTTFFFTIPIK